MMIVFCTQILQCDAQSHSEKAKLVFEWHVWTLLYLSSQEDRSENRQGFLSWVCKLIPVTWYGSPTRDQPSAFTFYATLHLSSLNYFSMLAVHIRPTISHCVIGVCTVTWSDALRWHKIIKNLSFPADVQSSCSVMTHQRVMERRWDMRLMSVCVHTVPSSIPVSLSWGAPSFTAPRTPQRYAMNIIYTKRSSEQISSTWWPQSLLKSLMINVCSCAKTYS